MVEMKGKKQKKHNSFIFHEGMMPFDNSNLIKSQKEIKQHEKPIAERKIVQTKTITRD